MYRDWISGFQSVLMWETTVRSHDIVTTKHLIAPSGISRLHQRFCIEVILTPQLALHEEQLVFRVDAVFLAILYGFFPCTVKEESRVINTRGQPSTSTITEVITIDVNPEVMLANCHHIFAACFYPVGGG